jgi:hypothetical protein
MLDSIIKAATEQLSGTLQQKAGLNLNDSKKALSFLQGPIVDTVKNQVSSGNISGLTSLFGGKENISGNPIVEGIVKNYTNSLVSKMGLSSSVAGTISNLVVPFITEKIVSNFASKGGINATDITSMLGGGGGVLGNITKGLGGLGKLFGK